MSEDSGTTPAGGGRVVARQFLRRRYVADRQAELGTNSHASTGAGQDKWQVLRALTEAKTAYGLSDRSIAVLEALVSFHPERLLDGSKPLIVFPSNQQLALRTRGMSPATIRRHVAALVEAGLIFRRDSPNGKRYCRRNADGQPMDMFGFDLAPLALAADAIRAQAEALRAQEKHRQRLRGEVTVYLRDIARLLQASLNEQRPGDWSSFEARLAGLSGRVGRSATIAALTERRDALLRLNSELEHAYLETISTAEVSASAHQFEHHIQNPESDQTLDSAVEDNDQGGNATKNGTVSGGEEETAEHREPVSLQRVLKACPQISDYSRNGISTWVDFMGAVALVRAMLKISPSSWNAARATMGEVHAAIAVAAILERADIVRSPGSYLRALAAKAGSGRFAAFPMIRALEQQRGATGRVVTAGSIRQAAGESLAQVVAGMVPHACTPIRAARDT